MPWSASNTISKDNKAKVKNVNLGIIFKPEITFFFVELQFWDILGHQWKKDQVH